MRLSKIKSLLKNLQGNALKVPNRLNTNLVNHLIVK